MRTTRTVGILGILAFVVALVGIYFVPSPHVKLSAFKTPADREAGVCPFTVSARLVGGLPWTRATWLDGLSEVWEPNGWAPAEEYDLTKEAALDFWGANRIRRRPTYAYRVFRPTGAFGVHTITIRFRYNLSNGDKGSTQTEFSCVVRRAHAGQPLDTTMAAPYTNDPRLRRLDSLISSRVGRPEPEWLLELEEDTLVRPPAIAP